MSTPNTSAFAPQIEGPGLFIATLPGNISINGTTTAVALATVALTANATNSVYVDLSGPTVAAGTSGFPAFSYPIATVVTSLTGVKTVTDVRGDVTLTSAGGAVTVTALTSATALPATAGVVRLAKTDTIDWRNNANGANVAISLSATDQVVLPATILTASVAAIASLNVPAGTAPTTSIVGDVWFDSTQKNVAFAQVASSQVFQSGVLSVLPAQAANTTITTAQTMGSFAMPASLMNVVGKTLRITGSGVYTTGAGTAPTITFSIKIGAVTVVSTATAAAVAQNATNIPFQVQYEVTTAAVGATGNDEAHGVLCIGITTGAGAALSCYPDNNTAVSSNYDHTAANTVAIQVAANNAVTSATLRQAVFELLN